MERKTWRWINAEAKSMVYYHGPSNVDEFGEEILEKYGYRDRLHPLDFQLLLAESVKQADRVRRFLFN